MPTPEELFADSIAANRHLKDTVLQKTAEGEARETRMETLHTTRLDQMQSTLNTESQNRAAQLQQGLADVRNHAPLQRLTPNATLIPNAGNNGFAGWESSYAITSAELVEWCSTGTPWDERSALQQEFMLAMGLPAGTRHFFGSFRIMRVNYSTASAVGDFLGGNHYQVAGIYTYGGIVKHESGVVPTGGYCIGLAAGEPAKVCRTQGFGGTPTSYTRYHPIIPQGSGSILLALPQAVNGIVPDGVWGIYPYLAHKDVDGYRVYE